MNRLRYIKLEDETDEQQEKLNSLLNNGEYNYEESEDALTFYAKQFIDYWKDDIKNDVRTAMKRVPKEMTDEYLLEKSLNAISDYESDIADDIVGNLVDDFRTEDDALSNLADSMVNRCYYIPRNDKEVNKIIDSVRNGLNEKMKIYDNRRVVKKI